MSHLKPIKILGIETSCDECSVSVVEQETSSLFKVFSLATFSQTIIHQPYGGVVPEIASRNHLETIHQMLDNALTSANLELSQLDGIAVTTRPGLIGALLVGVSTAKALAYALEKPLIPVHHLEGHAVSIFLDQNHLTSLELLPLPLLVAVVSGGHTSMYLAETSPESWPTDFLSQALVGRTRDDAAGEAFDKIAKLLGLPYPGGIWIDKKSENGNPMRFPLPRALSQKTTLDFSFSGLKTAAAFLIEGLEKEGKLKASLVDLCASVQEAIVDALLSKIVLAIRKFHCQSLAIVGGVAANRRLRFRLEREWKEHDLRIKPFFPKLKFCSDNAAMIAAAGAFRFRQGHFLNSPDFLTLNACAYPH